jgi:DMSO/TMAO reductase YedYZ heme-binding membrane subunit
LTVTGALSRTDRSQPVLMISRKTLALGAFAWASLPFS